MLGCSSTRILAGAVIFAAFTAPLHAQIRGAVQSGNVPFPNATVVLWDARHELARTITNAQGRFGFDATLAAHASGLVVRAIGHEPRTMTVRSGDVGLRIALTPLVQSLPATVVSATRRQCPFRDDPAARALWDAIRNTYVTAPPTVGHLAVMAWRTGDVTGAEVGEIDEAHVGSGSSGTTGYGRQQHAMLLVASGYAARRPPLRAGDTVVEPQYLAWWYPPLHRALLEHFVEPMFTARHVFRFPPAQRATMTKPGAPSSPTQLLFCPRTTQQPALEGVLDLAPDSSVARVRWLFVTPKPREDAGGEIVLVPPGSHVGRRLVPARGVYWRRLAGFRDRYYQDEAVYQGWYWGTTDSIPNLATGRTLP